MNESNTETGTEGRNNKIMESHINMTDDIKIKAMSKSKQL